MNLTPLDIIYYIGEVYEEERRTFRNCKPALKGKTSGLILIQNKDLIGCRVFIMLEDEIPPSTVIIENTTNFSQFE